MNTAAMTRAMEVVDYSRGQHQGNDAAHFDMMLLLGDILRKDTMRPTLYPNGTEQQPDTDQRTRSLLTANLLEKYGRDGLHLDKDREDAARRAQDERDAKERTEIRAPLQER